MVKLLHRDRWNGSAKMTGMTSLLLRMLMLLLLVGFSSSSATAASKETPVTTIHVFAASSLTEAFTQIAKQFEKDHPHAKVELNFAGTPTLRTQIEQGAPADVFASADRAHSEALQKQQLLLDTTVFARNKLVIAVPASKSKVASIADVAKPNIKIVIAEETVPA